MYSKEMLRVLGAGVSRLQDGDLKDRNTAHGVQEDLRCQGYLFDGYGMFHHRDAILVNCHMHPNGHSSADLTDSERERIIRDQGALLPEMDHAIDECRYLDLPELLLSTMAASIRNIRQGKGLHYEPRDL
jgi:hypothetical protein